MWRRSRVITQRQAIRGAIFSFISGASQTAAPLAHGSIVSILHLVALVAIFLAWPTMRAASKTVAERARLKMK